MTRRALRTALLRLAEKAERDYARYGGGEHADTADIMRDILREYLDTRSDEARLQRLRARDPGGDIRLY